MTQQGIAKLVSKTNLGNGFMKAEYEGDWSLDRDWPTRDADGNRTLSRVFESEGPHVIKWECRVEEVSDVINTTLTAAEYSPVSFHLTRTRPDGTTAWQGDFQLSRPGESREERFGYWKEIFALYDSSVKYKISFQYPVAEMPAALASPCLPLPSLQDDLRSMMLHGTFSDITVTAGSKKFNLHKGVLASRSDVFDRMLKADMVESRSNKIDVDMDENIAE